MTTALRENEVKLQDYELSGKRRFQPEDSLESGDGDAVRDVTPRRSHGTRNGSRVTMERAQLEGMREYSSLIAPNLSIGRTWRNAVKDLVIAGNTSPADQPMGESPVSRRSEPLDRIAIVLAKFSTSDVVRLFQRLNASGISHDRLATAIKVFERVANIETDSSLILRAARLDEYDQTEAALDIIYDGFDELFRNDQMEIADGLLRDVDAVSLSDALLVGILTATLPAKSNLPARTSFYVEAERLLTNRGSMEPGLLAGLE